MDDRIGTEPLTRWSAPELVQHTDLCTDCPRTNARELVPRPCNWTVRQSNLQQMQPGRSSHVAKEQEQPNCTVAGAKPASARREGAVRGSARTLCTSMQAPALSCATEL